VNVGRLRARAEHGKVRTNGKGREGRRKKEVMGRMGESWRVIVDEVKSGGVLTAERGGELSRQRLLPEQESELI
jgi:hypothetical protein